MHRLALVVVLMLSGAMLGARAPQYTPAPGTELLHRPLDEILDVNVRDGLVYYRALKGERGRLDRYIGSLNVPAATYEQWSKAQQMAFWVNAYNAVILQTVINHYPIRSRSTSYPANSIRQIPGYEQVSFRAAGRGVTLEQLEKTILPTFKEPRLYLALGRGAVGSGRLRSEAYTGDRLDRQLADLQQEFVNDRQMLRIDRLAGEMSVTPIFSWREQEFIAAYDRPDPAFAQRSPIERAILSFIKPSLLPLEKEFVQQNAFKVKFHEFDWRLNDLTGGRIE
jgi:Protein of unknown function, DUF547